LTVETIIQQQKDMREQLLKEYTYDQAIGKAPLPKKASNTSQKSTPAKPQKGPLACAIIAFGCA
jgi:hypothetical protein